MTLTYDDLKVHEEHSITIISNEDDVVLYCQECDEPMVERKHPPRSSNCCYTCEMIYRETR